MKLAGMVLFLVYMYHSGICQQIRLDTDRMEKTAYPSFLLVSYEDKRYEIVGESDYATDRTLRYTLRIGEPMTFEGVFPRDSPIASASDSFFSTLKSIDFELLDSAMRSVDPLRMFPELSSMGTITLPKGYVFLLIAFLSVGGVLIFLADTMQSHVRRKSKATRKPDKADRVVRDFKMQSVFEAFVITLFDPLYFRHRRPKAERVLAGKISEGETAPDLAFEFNHKDMHARFAVKCLYFRNAARSEIQLFSAQRRPSFENYEEEHDMPLYFILGFGGTPDDPRELYLLPRKSLPVGTVKKEALKPYSKSGMFFYNSAAGRLQ